MAQSQATKMSLIYYHIPTDMDESAAPNAFPLAKNRAEIKLKDIRAKFPLPGTYHFRFKLKWGDGSAVFLHNQAYLLCGSASMM